MNMRELQKDIDALPNQSSEYIIRWLMSQVIELMEIIDYMEHGTEL